MNPNSNLSSRDSILSPGELAPDFELTTQDRQPWRLSTTLATLPANGSGGVALSFFPMAFTGVCASEMKCLSAESQRWAERGYQVVGVSCDSFPVLKEWAAKEGYAHTFLADMHRSVCKGYGLYWPDLNVAWRGTVLISKNRKVVWSQKREIKEAFNLDQVLAAMA